MYISWDWDTISGVVYKVYFKKLYITLLFNCFFLLSLWMTQDMWVLQIYKTQDTYQVQDDVDLKNMLGSKCLDLMVSHFQCTCTW